MFKIIIQKIEEQESLESTYEVIGNKPDGSNLYGYVKKPVTKEVELNVYTQVRETLTEDNLIAIIKAINGIQTT